MAGPAPAPPVVVAAEMGYGHLRPALALCEVLEVSLTWAEKPPVADAAEVRTWARMRSLYETTSRATQWPLLGAGFKWALDTATAIPPLHPLRDLSAPDAGARAVERMRASGLCSGLVRQLQESGAPLVTTFYAPAVIADAAGCAPVWCLITDSDCARAWVGLKPGDGRARYLAPSRRVVRRLQAYGVAPDRIHLTGFPLPPSLLGGRDLVDLRRNLARRLVRLDPNGHVRSDPGVRAALPELAIAEKETLGPPTLVFAVGGAGAQAGLADAFLPSLAPRLRAGQLRLVLVAGTRPEVAARFRGAVAREKLECGSDRSVDIIAAGAFDDYAAAFHGALADADVLWTKPSELTFFAALGLPILCAPAVGVQEVYNRRWVQEAGAGIDQRDPQTMASWRRELREDGTLASAAWAGFSRLPQDGVYRIADLVRGLA